MDWIPEEPFTAAYLTAQGVGRRALRTALADGAVRRVLHGVYAGVQVPDTVETRCQAVGLVTHEAHVLRDRTAAWLHGVEVFGWNEMELLPPVETSALRGRNVSRRGGCDTGSRDLNPIDVMTLHGMKVTTPLRTALDLGCNLRGRDALAALDQFRRLHGFSTEDLVRQLPRYRRRRGVVQLRLLVTWADPLAESQPESWVRYEILGAGMKAPVLQFWVTHRGVPIYRLDLAYPHLKIAIEYDGEEFHGVRDEQHDRERREWLRAHGWYVLVLDKNSLSARAVDAWLSELSAVVRERSGRRF